MIVVCVITVLWNLSTGCILHQNINKEIATYHIHIQSKFINCHLLFILKLRVINFNEIVFKGKFCILFYLATHQNKKVI